MEKATQEGQLLAFADDLLLIAKDKAEATKLITSLQETFEQFDLQVNLSKSAILTSNSKVRKEKQICGIEIQETTKYLGVTIST